MNETLWTHIGVAAGVLVPVMLALLAIWWDIRKRADDNAQRQVERSEKVSERLTAIETKINPIWNWWNKINGEH